MIGTFVSLDLILFYLFFEAVLIPMFIIIGVWGGKNRVYASHNGYKNIGITHFRSFEFFKQKIIIKDSLKGSQKNIAESHIHFHPDRSVIMISNNIIEVDKKIHLKFYGYKNIKIKDFKYSLGFNKNKTGKKIIADIKYESKIIIKLNEN